jgi:hypothetical protein
VKGEVGSFPNKRSERMTPILMGHPPDDSPARALYELEKCTTKVEK